MNLPFARQKSASFGFWSHHFPLFVNVSFDRPMIPSCNSGTVIYGPTCFSKRLGLAILCLWPDEPCLTPPGSCLPYPWHARTCCTLNSTYNEVTFNKKLAIRKEISAPNIPHSPIMTSPLMKSAYNEAKSPHIFFCYRQSSVYIFCTLFILPMTCWGFPKTYLLTRYASPCSFIYYWRWSFYPYCWASF